MDSTEPIPEARRTRRWRLAAGLASAVALLIALVVAAGMATNPRQAMLDAREPEPASLSATVERRQLTDVLVLPGRVGAESVVAITVPPGGDGAALVTLAPPPAGHEVDAGALMAAISGRPLIALPGPLPAYRDLRPGDRGDDVAQLQRALAAVGIPTEDDGVYGAATAESVSHLYERLGFAPALSSADAPDLLREAQEEVARARADLRATEHDHTDAAEDAAREAGAAEAAVRAAREQVASAGTSGDGLIEVAAAELVAAERRRDRLAADPDASEDERDAAEVGVVRAKTALADARTSAATMLAEARASLEAAEAAAARLRRTTDDGAVVAARAAVEQAEQRAARVRATTGAMLPRDEVAFLPALPALVASSTGEVGSSPPEDEPLITLTTGALVVHSDVEQHELDLLDLGMLAEVAGNLGEEGNHAALTELTPRDSGGARAVFTPVDPLPADLAGRPVQVTVTRVATDGEVLAVPVTALRTNADGTTSLVMATPLDDEPDVRPVEVGVVAGGWAEVSGADVAAGDRVVISP